MIALLSSSFVVLILFVLIVLFLHFVPLGLWVSALAAGVNVGIFTLVGMRLRRVVPSKIVLPLVKANKAGLDVNVDQLEAHYLAGGDVDRVVDALIAAERAAIPLTFERAAAIDLAGRDVLEAVQMSVNPKVIETPLISAVAKNGIELKVRPVLRFVPILTVCWRCRGIDHHCPSRRRHCHHGRFLGRAYGRPRKPGSYFPHGP
mgnify:CR=1 FL=1